EMGNEAAQFVDIAEPRAKFGSFPQAGRPGEQLHLSRRSREAQITDAIEVKAEAFPAAKLAQGMETQRDVELAGELRADDPDGTPARARRDRLRLQDGD